MGWLDAYINPVIRGWGNYYRRANVRGLFHRLDGWIVRRLYSFLAKRWRNAMWRGYPMRRLIETFGLVRLTHLIPGLISQSFYGWNNKGKRLTGKLYESFD